MLPIFRYKTVRISRSINPTKDNLLWQSHFVNPSSDVIDRLLVSFLCIIYLKAEYDNQKLSLPYNSSSLLETIFPISKFLCTLQAARNDPHLPKTLPSTPNSSEKLWASSNRPTLPTCQPHKDSALLMAESRFFTHQLKYLKACINQSGVAASRQDCYKGNSIWF